VPVPRSTSRVLLGSACLVSEPHTLPADTSSRLELLTTVALMDDDLLEVEIAKSVLSMSPAACDAFMDELRALSA
jgi:hypothetical protein